MPVKKQHLTPASELHPITHSAVLDELAKLGYGRSSVSRSTRTRAARRPATSPLSTTPSSSETSDSETSDSETSDSETSGSETLDSETSESETSESETSASETDEQLPKTYWTRELCQAAAKRFTVSRLPVRPTVASPVLSIFKSNQCLGDTLKNVRCKRTVRSGRGYCHDHVGQALASRPAQRPPLAEKSNNRRHPVGSVGGEACYPTLKTRPIRERSYDRIARRDSDETESVASSDETGSTSNRRPEEWIPASLSSKTKDKLLAKMAQPLPSNQPPAYIYAFEIIGKFALFCI
ncbi:hypothetical protein FRC12_014305 [Ceratobasidium sp. 428]|nr:hypothetical protein FRC12_014305 [Ceratobasidium sp. 428]